MDNNKNTALKHDAIEAMPNFCVKTFKAWKTYLQLYFFYKIRLGLIGGVTTRILNRFSIQYGFVYHWWWRSVFYAQCTRMEWSSKS